MDLHVLPQGSSKDTSWFSEQKKEVPGNFSLFFKIEMLIYRVSGVQQVIQLYTHTRIFFSIIDYYLILNIVSLLCCTVGL